MKTLTYIILLAPFLMISCTTKEPKVSSVPKVVAHDSKGLTIVYYSNDSIKENFLFYKQQDAIVTKNLERNHRFLMTMKTTSMTIYLIINVQMRTKIMTIKKFIASISA